MAGLELLSNLSGYLKHANRIRRDEGVAPLLEAAKITDFYIKTFTILVSSPIDSRDVYYSDM